MEFDYQLSNDDIKLVKSEMNNNRILLKCINLDKLLSYEEMFVSLVISLLISLFFNMSFFKFLLLSVSMILFIKIFLLFLASFSFPIKRFSSFINKAKGRLYLDYENLNFYTQKEYFSCNTSQIKGIFETDNFYILAIQHFFPLSNLVIPKSIINVLNNKDEFFHFLNHYKTKERILKPMFFQYKINSYIMCSIAVIILAYFALKGF